MEVKNITKWKKVLKVDLDNLATEFKDTLTEPSVIILTGAVGAGKTTFVKKFFGENGFSPSYSIINDSADIVHADFYRLKSSEEIMHLELSLYMDQKLYLFIEWGKNYILDVYRELGDSYKYYELEIITNAKLQENVEASRDFVLNELVLI